MSTPLLPLRRVFKVVNGGTPTSDEINWDGDVPWATPADFGPQLSSIDTTRRTLSGVGVRTGSTVVPKGALLISTRAPVGYVAVASQAMAFNQGCRALVPHASADTRFFGYQLEARKSDLQAEGLGTTFLELSSDKLAAFRVHVPPFEEQCRIADFLDAETARIDSMVSTIRRLRSVLSERKEVQRSLALRGVHSHGSRTMHPMLGDLPDSWPVLPLKRLVPRIGVGVVVDPSSYFSERGLPFLRGSNVTDGGINLQDVRYISEADSRKLWRSRLSSGDVVVIRAGYPGRAAVVPAELEGANCASILILKKGDRLIPKYLEAYFNSRLGKSYVDSVRYGAAQEQINVSHVVDFMCPAPSPDEQQEIISEIEKHERPIAALDHKLSAQAGLLGLRRQALITAAVTGQFDVSTASGRNVTDGGTA